MRRFSLMPTVAVLALALLLPDCGAGSNIGSFIQAATAPITNPVKPVNLYQGKLAFAASQDLVWKYQTDCFGSDAPPYPVTVAKIQADPVLLVQCKHRVSRYNAMKDAEGKAFTAIALADDFITRNPTGNATSYIAAALKAVIAYQTTVGG